MTGSNGHCAFLKIPLVAFTKIRKQSWQTTNVNQGSHQESNKMLVKNICFVCSIGIKNKIYFVGQNIHEEQYLIFRSFYKQYRQLFFKLVYIAVIKKNK